MTGTLFFSFILEKQRVTRARILKRAQPLVSVRALLRWRAAGPVAPRIYVPPTLYYTKEIRKREEGMFFLIGFAILIFSIIIHELAHGLTAERLGDPTARLMGRLTLNPLSHIDPLLTILLPLILVFSGSPIIFGAAKPVPIDPFNFREPKKDLGLVGLAGPLSNLFLAILGAILAKIFLFSLPSLKLLVFYNLLLAAFNLIPIPPLDGSRILAAILPEKYNQILSFLEPYGLFILFFFLLFPIGGFSLGEGVFHLVSFWMRLLGL